jgi:hypothetical protein
MKIKGLIALVMICTLVRAADTSTEVQVDTTPFEPPAIDFYCAKDKFAHPPEKVAPRFLLPYEPRLGHGLGGLLPAEVIILVHVDSQGLPKQLKVLSSTHNVFARVAIFSLQKARWDVNGESWFYYRHVYTFDDDQPNKSPEATPGQGPPAELSPSSGAPQL